MRCVCVAKEERCFATNDRDERANVVAISQSVKLSNSADRGNMMSKKKNRLKNINLMVKKLIFMIKIRIQRCFHCF